MSGIEARLVEVLAEHHDFGWQPATRLFACRCGVPVVRPHPGPAYRAHVAAALAVVVAEEVTAARAEVCEQVLRVRELADLWQRWQIETTSAAKGRERPKCVLTATEAAAAVRDALDPARAAAPPNTKEKP